MDTYRETAHRRLLPCLSSSMIWEIEIRAVSDPGRKS
jgi:hypothetical protein